MMRAAALVAATFLAMEAVSYASHRWVMHGIAFSWHRSHHLPASGRFEKNDRFPIAFSALGFGLFLIAAMGPARATVFWVAVGVTAYGVAYLFVHELCIHRRLPIRVGKGPYWRWLRDSHQVHHRFSGEPYGMLLPFVSHSRRESARNELPTLDRSGYASRRDNARSARTRL